MPRILTAVALGAVVAAGAAGCGGSSTPASQVTVTKTVTTPAGATHTGGGSASTSTSASNSSTAATTTGTTTATAGLPACVASDLALLSEGSNGAAGTVVTYFAFRNVTQRPCHTYGWPGVLFLDKAGTPLPTDAQRTTNDLLGDTPAVPIVINPGKLASFRIVAHLIGSGAGCKTASGLQAIAPDDTATMRTTISGGLFECTHVTLSPLALGTGIPAGT